MKKSVFLIFAVLISSSTFAQKMYGEMNYEIQTIRPKSTTFIECEMYFSETESINYHLNTKNSDASVFTPGKIEKGKIYQYKNFLEKNLQSSEPYKCIVKTNLNPVKWKILNNKKKIGNYECQMAKAKLFGRDYIAWFCPKIASQSGPWKLYGLPGLILEAEDETGEIKFVLKSLSFTKTIKEKIAPPLLNKNIKVVSRDEYLAIRKIEIEKNAKPIFNSGSGWETKMTITNGRGIEIYE